MTMDLFPTILEAAGLKPAETIDGRSFLPTLLGRKQPPLRKVWYFVRREGGRRYAGKTIHAVQEGPWKLVHNIPFGPLELYRLDKDPKETTNLARRMPAKADALRRHLEAHIQEGGRVPWQPPAEKEAAPAVRETRRP